MLTGISGCGRLFFLFSEVGLVGQVRLVSIVGLVSLVGLVILVGLVREGEKLGKYPNIQMKGLGSCLCRMCGWIVEEVIRMTDL